MARLKATLASARAGEAAGPAAGTRAPGRLIVLEGPDGVGKSAVAAEVTVALRATEQCELFSFPGREPGTLGHLVYAMHHDSAGFGIDSITQAALQTLHIAAHLDAIERHLIPALRAGHDVVLDRFWWSTFVYGAVGGLDRALLTALIDVERRAWGACRPHLAVLLRRDTPIDRDDEDLTRWLALRREYDGLAAAERGGHPVLMVENAHSIAVARDQILAALRAPPPPNDNNPCDGEGGGALGARYPTESHTQLGPRSAPQPGVRPGRGGRGMRGHADQIAIPMADGHPSALVATSTEMSTPVGVAPRLPAPPQLLVKHLAPAKVTAVYETYWRFAAERQRVFFRRVDGVPAPWTDDPILATFKFTNAYRAADRVSQYLIRNVIYRDDLPSSAEEVCFRILLFKFFNKIETWQLLERELGPVTWKDFHVTAYDGVLAAAMARGRRIYSAAYIMPPGARAFGHAAKHRNHLALLEHMMAEKLAARLEEARSMQQAFELLRSYPTIGDFLAYQFVTDINYSDVTHFSEMDFVVAGPGALSGIRKCFADTGGLNEPEIIRLVTDLQAEEFPRLGLDFRSLWGRPLQLIDCQNLFCEVDKYARVRHPEVEGRAGRTQIKQKYSPGGEKIAYWFPPKWQLNARIEQGQVTHDRSEHSVFELLPPVRHDGAST